MQISLNVTDRSKRVTKPRIVSDPVKYDELLPEEQTQYNIAKKNIDHYTHVVKQIHRILEIDGIKPLFLLQPELILSRKRLTASETRLKDYYRKVSGAQVIYTYEQLVPELSRQMTSTATADNFSFLDLTNAFDGTEEQTFSDYVHLTPAGNKIIAERVFQYISDEWVPKTIASN